MDPVTISADAPEHPILDYAALVAAGMAQLERLAGDAWTDFNAHDPGITLLEAGCYALTDLGYRIFHPVPDLLADGGADAAVGLFTPSEALTGRAVTLDDLRRVALDVTGVKNAWVERVDQPAVRLRYDDGPKEQSIDLGQPASPTSAPITLAGLYRVVVEKSDLEDADSPSLRRAVARRLHAHRNLCEDFEEITVLDPLPVAVLASVEIGETENGADVLLGILERVGAYVSPTIGFFSLTQALASGAAIDTVFDGPALARGFVDTASLAAGRRRQALHTSDVIREIMAVPGVRAVRTIRLARAGDTVGEAWSLAVDAGGAPRLDLDFSQISLFKGRLSVTVDKDIVAAAYRARARTARLFPVLPLDRRDVRAPAGQDRDVAAYVPLQNELPLAYGIGAGALPAAASDARHAQANQLRAYLALFDQPLANEFAQLAHLRCLFSVADDTSVSYASQLVGAVPAGGDGTTPAPILAPTFDAAALQAMVEAPGAAGAIRRRNRFLNHLLARFAETITDDPQATNAVAGADPATLDVRLLDAKRRFLAHFPHLSGARGTGCDYLSADGADSAPALAERVRLKLGLPNDPALRFLVVEHILLRAVAEDAVNALPFLAAAARDDPFSLQLSFVLPVALQHLAPLIETVAREETPAHLVAYIVWLDPDPFAAFARAYGAWLATLRSYWLADRFGLDPGDLTAGPGAP
ncbi:MAG TPA: hypothetical protein VHS58_15645 [Acetobacteraceae bacterium]|nr:hypothetical protein [Acetobacteraceae bacterium]